MKNQELFDKTVGILVRAYFNNTLQHSNCHACAVGNIIAANNNIRFNSNAIAPMWIDTKTQWQAVHSFCDGIQYFNTSWGDYKEGVKQIESTGYTLDESAKIEFAFEKINYTGDDDKDMFNGLMSVIDCLSKIHEADETETQSAKSLFKKELAV